MTKTDSVRISLMRTGSNAKGNRPYTRELKKVLENFRTENKSKPVTTLRENLLYHTREGRPQEVHALPVVMFAACFPPGSGRSLITYNGIILLEVNGLSGLKEAGMVREIASQVPHTLATFIGAGGRSVKILVPFTRPDGTLPSDRDQALLFHAHAYIQATRLYRSFLPFSITLKEPLLERGCRASYDPGLYYNPEVIPVPLKQPLSMPDETAAKTARSQETNPFQRMFPGYDQFRLTSTLYETSFHATRTTVGEFHPENNRKMFLVQLARNCLASGIPEENAVKWTLLDLDLAADELEVRETFRNQYASEKKSVYKPVIRPEQLLTIQMEEFMKRRYDFRYNTQLMEVEYRKNHSFIFYYRMIDNRVVNSIALDAMQEGIQLWDRDVKRYLYSDRVPVYSPLEEYLHDLPEWDGKDHIRALAGLVPCRFEKWPDFFYRWFLGMVAQWTGRNRVYANQVAPLLVGKQGYGKSTFCKKILPPELKDFYSDSIDFSRKRDSELYLHRFALINIDEFDQISLNQQGFLKHMLQKNEINYRAPHQSGIRPLRRYASFIATSNHKDLLTDLSGNRRFICVEITEQIDNNRIINYNQLYAQALRLLTQQERYHFTPEEEKILTRNNESFRQVSSIEQLFLRYYRIAGEKEKCKSLLASEILENIRDRSKLKLSDQKAITFGRLLHQLQIPIRKSGAGLLYRVIERDE